MTRVIDIDNGVAVGAMSEWDDICRRREEIARELEEAVEGKMMSLDTLTLWEAFSECSVIECAKVVHALRDYDTAAAGLQLYQIVEDYIRRGLEAKL